MPGWRSSAGSGPLTSTLSNATSTAWILIAWVSPHRRKGRQRRRWRGPNRERDKGERNENQSDQRFRERPGEGLALLHGGTGLCQEDRFQSGPISLADGGLT